MKLGEGWAEDSGYPRESNHTSRSLAAEGRYVWCAQSLSGENELNYLCVADHCCRALCHQKRFPMAEQYQMPIHVECGRVLAIDNALGRHPADWHHLLIVLVLIGEKGRVQKNWVHGKRIVNSTKI